MEDNYYSISVEYTKKYGIIKAALISRIEFWCEYNKKKNIKDRFKDGHWWSGYLSSKDLSNQIGLSRRTIEKNISELIKSEIIYKGKYNKEVYDKTNWYRINPLPLESNTHYSNRVEPLPSQSNTITPTEYTHYSNRVEPLLSESKPIPSNPFNHYKSTCSTPDNPPVNPELLKKTIDEKIRDEKLKYICLELIAGNSITINQKNKLDKNKSQLIKSIPILKYYLN